MKSEISKKLLKPANILYDFRFEIVILIFVAIFLSPIINSPYLSDDGIYYFLRGDSIINDRGMKKMIVANFMSWVSRGRFFPFSEYALLIFYYIKNVHIYKLLIILSVCFDVALFGIVIEKFTKSKRAKLMSMLTIALFFQVLTTYHCAFVAFQMFMQVLLALLFLIIICMQNYYESGRKVHLIFGIIFYSISLMTYELAFTYFVIIVGLIWYFSRRIKDIIKMSALYAVPTLIVGLINIKVKMDTTVRYEGISVNLDPKMVIATFIKQCTAAFPMANYIFQRNNGILQNTVKGVLKNITVQDVLITALFLSLLYLVRKQIPAVKITINKWKFLLIAFLIYIMPAILISISAKYQSELSMGYGYLPVYLQYFGLSLLIWGITFIICDHFKTKIDSQWLRKIRNGFIIILFTIILLLNLQNERLYINSTYAFWQYPKQAAFDSIQLGILNDVQEKDSITTLTSYVWENSSYFSEYANRKINYLPLGNISAESDDLYLYRYYGSQTDESAFAGKLDKADPSGTEQLVSTLEIYTNNLENTYVFYSSVDEDNNAVSNIVPLEDLQLMNAFGTGRLFRIDSDQKIDFSTVTFMKNFTPAKGSLYFVFGEGVYGLEYNASGSWHWCQKNIQMSIVNTQEKPVQIKLYLNVSNMSEAISNLDIKINGIVSEYQYNYLGTDIVVDAAVQPGSNIVELSTDAAQVYAPKDPRTMYFRVSKVKLDKVD